MIHRGLICSERSRVIYLKRSLHVLSARFNMSEAPLFQELLSKVVFRRLIQAAV